MSEAEAEPIDQEAVEQAEGEERSQVDDGGEFADDDGAHSEERSDNMQEAEDMGTG